MSGYTAQRHHDRGVLSRTYYREDALPPASLWDRAQQPSVLVPLVLFLFGIFYNSLHKSPLHRHRHPGQVLWDLIVTITPTSLLYFLDDYFTKPASDASAPSITSTRPQTYTAKSEALRRILGLDNSDSIIRTVASAGLRRINSLTNSSLLGNMTTVKVGQPAGLYNPSVTCYQNSILQALSALPSVAEYVAQVEPLIAQVSSPDERNLACKLRDLLEKLQTYNGGQTIRPSRSLKFLPDNQQQDAHEYLLRLLGQLDDDIKAVASIIQSRSLPGLALEPTPTSQSNTVNPFKDLKNPLDGGALETLACVRCGFTNGSRKIPITCLTFELGWTTRFGLEQGLDHWSKLERMDGVYCPKCTLQKMQRLLTLIVERGKEAALPDEALMKPQARLDAVEEALAEGNFDDETLKKCDIEPRHYVKTTKTKQQILVERPRCLSMHFNRSCYDSNIGFEVKNPAPVRFPKYLDIGPWTSGSAEAGGTDSQSTAETGDVERWTSNPGESQVAGSQGKSMWKGPVYRLRAVIVHRGHHTGGHYVCYKQRPWRNPKAADEDESVESDTTQPLTKHVFPWEEDFCSPPPVDDYDEVPMQWWCFSDSTVYRVAEDDVMGQESGVFMLFYEMVDPNVYRTSELEEKAAPATDELAQEGASEPDASEAGVSEADTEPASSLDDESLAGLTPGTSESDSVDSGLL